MFYVLERQKQNELSTKGNGNEYLSGMFRGIRRLLVGVILLGLTSNLSFAQTDGETVDVSPSSVVQADIGNFNNLTFSNVINIILTSVIAALAFLSIVAPRNRERRKNVLDFLFRSSNDSRTREGYALIQKIHSDPKQDVKTFAYQEHDRSEEAALLRHMLNEYENIAVGIKMGVYCEKTFFRIRRSTVLKVYNMAQDYISGVRAQNNVPTYYMELEELAKRWEKKSLTVSDSYKWISWLLFWK